MKWRNTKERELLSVGGSRDTTLPGKDNPNPDLSDPAATASHNTQHHTPANVPPSVSTSDT